MNKSLASLILFGFCGFSFAECNVEVTAIKSDCDGFGSSCFDYHFVNDTDNDYMACIWDNKTTGGFAFCTFADRRYQESFEDVIIGPVEVENVKDYKAECLSEADSEKLF